MRRTKDADGWADFSCESWRRVLAGVTQWGGWLGALGVFVYATLRYDPHKGDFAPQWVGFAFIFLIGVAIAGTTARSRMRLSDTIVQVFQTGVRQGLDALSRGDDHRRSRVQQGLDGLSNRDKRRPT